MKTWLVIIVALFAGFLGSYLSPAKTTANITKENAYERVMRTKTLRCAYYNWPPFNGRNINTNAQEGVLADYVNAVGQRYGLKIEWVLELVPGNEIEQINSGAADAICGGASYNAAMVQGISFSQAIFYDPAVVFVRADNTKVNNYDDLNKPDVVFTALDGDLSHDLPLQMFPQAKMQALPGSAQPGQMLEDIKTGKADAAVLESLTMQKLGPEYSLDYRMINPPNASYIGLYSLGFGTRAEDTQLLQMLSQIVEDMRNIGLEAQVMNPWYKKFPGGMISPRDFNALKMNS